MTETLIHSIPPLYDPHARVLILGSFPSPKSRQSGFFYGHPQNRFWQVLAAVLNAPVPTTVEEKKALALTNRIAIWDVIASCEIQGADDSSIRNPLPNDLRPLLEGAAIRKIFTTGKKSTLLYQKHLEKQTGMAAEYLPSPSPANRAVSLEKLIEAYRSILPWLKDEA